MRTLNIIVYAIALALAVAAYLKGEQRHILGITEASKTLLLVLPTLVGAFLIAGYVRVLMPEDVVRKWLGEESGLKGVVVGYLVLAEKVRLKDLDISRVYESRKLSSALSWVFITC